MSESEFQAQQADYLTDVPAEFHAAIRRIAWEHGHAAGYQDVLYYTAELAGGLAEPIRKYAERLAPAPSRVPVPQADPPAAAPKRRGTK